MDEAPLAHSLSVHRKKRSHLTLLMFVLLLAMLCLLAFHDCFAFPIANSPSVFELSGSAAFTGHMIS